MGCDMGTPAPAPVDPSTVSLVADMAAAVQRFARVLRRDINRFVANAAGGTFEHLARRATLFNNVVGGMVTGV